MTRPSSLLRAHAPDHRPLRPFAQRWWSESLQVVVSPCGTWPFPTLSLQSAPRCPPGARARFFPGNIGLTSKVTRSAHQFLPAMQLPQGVHFRGCRHSLMFRLPRSLGPQIAPTAETHFRAARPFTPRNILVGYLPQAVVSLRIQHEQLMRLDFHQQDCSLVGCSHFRLHPQLTALPAEGIRRTIMQN